MDGYIMNERENLALRVGVESAYVDEILSRSVDPLAHDSALSLILRDDMRQMEQARRAHLLSLSQASIHIDQALSNLLVTIGNRDFIADGVVPVVNVPRDTDKFWKWDADTYFEEQEDAKVGVEGLPGRIRLKTTTDSFATTDYALMDLVTAKELQNADSGLALEASVARAVMNRLLIARERRVATMVFNASNYTGVTSALAGATQWDNSSSDPVQAILDALETPVLRPNVMVMGAQVWLKLQTHAKLTSMIYGRASTSEGATPMRPTLAMLAAAFELDAVYVGRAKYNTNREGATAASSYIWGKSAAFLRVEPNPSPRETGTFAYTFRSLAPVAERIEERLRGRSGGTWIKVAMSDAEKIVAGTAAGYLYTTAVS